MSWHSCKTKAEAEKKAKALKKRMKGKGWKIRVSENMGWHYSVYNNGMTVYEDEWKGKIHYWVLFGSAPGCGECDWTQKGKDSWFDDPNEAVAAQLKYAKAVIRSYTTRRMRMIRDVEKNFLCPRQRRPKK